MNSHAIFGGKLAAVASILLFCLTLSCVAADQPTVLVVAQDGAQLFYHKNGQPTAMEELPKGTELMIESTSGERCFVTYKGKPAYIRRQFLLTRDEFKKPVVEAGQTAKGVIEDQGKSITPDEQFRQDQTAKGLVEYQGEWLTPAEKFRREQTAKGLIEYDGHWLTPEDEKAAIQKNLMEAVEKGDSTRFQELLNTNADLIGATNSEGTTLLQAAVTKQDEHIVSVLLERGAGVNVRDKNGNTPLHMAASGGNTNLVTLLIAKGAEVNSRAENGQTPLHAAVASDQIAVVELLMQHGAHLEATDANGQTALQLAVALKREAIADLLSKEEARKLEQANEGKRRKQEEAKREEERGREQAAHEVAEKVRAGVLSVPELLPIFRGMTKGEVTALLGRPNVVSWDGNEFQYYDKAYSVLKDSKDTILVITFRAEIVYSVGLNGEKARRAD